MSFKNTGMLFYIHGYQSNPESEKGRLFRDELGAVAIRYRDCEPESLVIRDCLERILEVVPQTPSVTLIGSSLGGFLAAATARERPNVKNLVLLNPAIIPPTADLSEHWTLPAHISQDMLDMRLFREKLSSAVYMIRGTEDTVIPLEWNIEFAMAQEATIRFLCDDHRLSLNMARLPALIAEILGSKMG